MQKPRSENCLLLVAYVFTDFSPAKIAPYRQFLAHSYILYCFASISRSSMGLSSGGFGWFGSYLPLASFAASSSPDN